MTEEEAKTKWCPARPDAHDNPKCIASACMAWRVREDNGYRLNKDGHWVTGHVPDAQGYCGLAGAP